jgi:O-antigen/teichoic acid export membrane protein
MDQIYWKTGQLILGAVIGTVSVAIYSVAIQLTMSYMGFSANISSVFLPKLSALAVKNDLTETNNIFIKIGRLQFYVVMLIFFGFLLFGKQFISLWVGDSFLPAYYYTLLFMGALIIPLIQNTGILILQAKNKHAFRAIIYLIIAIISVMVSIPLTKKYGAMACAIVTASCLLLGQGLIINIYYNHLGIAIMKFWKEIIRLFIPMLIPVISFILFLNYYSIQNNVLNLLWQIIVFIVFYSFVLWKFDFNNYEKNLILSIIRKLKK